MYIFIHSQHTHAVYFFLYLTSIYTMRNLKKKVIEGLKSNVPSLRLQT